jgi:hypothetical protein
MATVKENRKILQRALDIVLELASENALDPEDSSVQNYAPLLEEAKKQEQSIEIIRESVSVIIEEMKTMEGS